MAHHYAIRTFDETEPVVRGGATAAYEAAGNTLATVVPPDWRLIQLIETGRQTELDAVTGAFAALLQEVCTAVARPGRQLPGPARRPGEGGRRGPSGRWVAPRDGDGHERV